MNRSPWSFTSILACSLFAVSAGLLAPLAAAEQTFIPHTAEYKVKISVLGGKLQTRFSPTDDGYMAESMIKATGMSRMLAKGTIRERSWFSEEDGEIRPTQYRSVDTLSKNDKVVDLDFNWANEEVTGVINGEDFAAGLDDSVHDRVSLQYALMYDLMAGIERDDYFLQDAEELKKLSATNIGTKRVKVPFGKFEATGIQHQAENSSRVTTLWCVEELGYLPVVIEQHRKGKRNLRAVLTKYIPTETVTAAAE